ncbi:hypothetical protein pb186bvf_007164 [Paramecium bursaria]
MKSFLSFDLFEKKVDLLVKHQEGHRTLIGSFLSLTLISIILYGLIDQLIALYGYQNAKMFVIDVYKQQPELFVLDENNFTLRFQILQAQNFSYVDESIWSVDAYLVKKEYIIVEGKTSFQYDKQEIQFSLCDDQNNSQFSEIQVKTNIYCINWHNNQTLSLGGEQEIYIQLDFNTCVNNTNNTQCKSQEEINNSLKSTYLILETSTIELDIHNQTKAFSSQKQYIKTLISSDTFKQLNYYYKPVLVQTDIGLIGKSNIIEKGLSYYQHNEIMDIHPSNNFFTAKIKLTNTQSENYRSYPKLQNILAEIGGLWNILFLIMKYIQYPLSVLSYKIFLLNQLFNFEGQEENENEDSFTKIQNSDNKNNLQSDANEQIFLQKLDQNNKDNVILGNSDEIQGTQKNYRKIKQRLQSLKQKKLKLDASNDENNEKSYKNDQLKEQLQDSLKRFFNTISRHLRLNFIEYLTQLRYQSNKQKRKQYDFASQKMEKSLDILYIIKKIQEIDKLKMILLDSSQIKLFDYLPKPLITLEPDNLVNQQYFSILSASKSNIQKAIEAQEAFRDIITNFDNPINQKLVKSMNPDILLLLKMQSESKNLIQVQKIDSQIVREMLFSLNGSSSKHLQEDENVKVEEDEEKILDVQNI